MKTSFDLIGKGLLPFMGGMRRFIPFLFDAAQTVVPMSEWSKWSFHDMTCGSCAGSAAFGYYGMSVTANDLALRSTIPAQAIFGGIRVHWRDVERLMRSAGPNKAPEGKRPARELHNNFLHDIAADLFDTLFYAFERGEVPQEQDAFMKYMAIRWVLLNKGYVYFVKLPTQDLPQLAIQSPIWGKTVDMLRDPIPAMKPVVEQVNALIHAQVSARQERPALVIRGDCRESIKQVQWDRPSFVNLNPPTDGNDRFMQSNRMLDTLLFNEQQPKDDGMMPGDLWKSLILDTCKHVPAGHYVFSFVGDGAISWEEGNEEVFAKVGPTVREWSFPWHGSDTRKAGLVLLRRE